MLLRSAAAAAFLTSILFAQGRVFPFPAPDFSAAEARDTEIYLHSHPEDRSVLKRLLNYYQARWESDGAKRYHLIIWTIEHHPDIDLDPPSDGRALLVNPDDRQDYAQARELWLKQVRQHPDHPRVLQNAAVCLRLTDRESAAEWLKRAITLDAGRRGPLISALGDVYAAAISGESGMNPFEGPTSVDAAEITSDFARRARVEAAADAEIAARTGWSLYLTTEAFHRLNLSAADYDAVAEELLLKSAALDYPKPAAMGMLGTFYQRQERKKSGQVLPKSRIVTVPPDQQTQRLLSKTISSTVTGEKAIVGPVQVAVDLIVGTDGHVWKAVPKDAPTQLIASAASGAVTSWTYQPLEINGELVRVATSVTLTIDTRP